jgi:hypothetical protein
MQHLLQRIDIHCNVLTYTLCDALVPFASLLSARCSAPGNWEGSLAAIGAYMDSVTFKCIPRMRVIQVSEEAC